MAITKLNSGQVRFQDPKSVVFIPWVTNATSGVYAIGGNGYDIHDIVGDTFSLTSDDAERNEVAWEFGDTPLDVNVSMGKQTVTMQCLDFQNDILLNLFGCETMGNHIVFPNSYKNLICTIIFSFDDKSLIMPKVSMDSKAVFENLRSDIARGELTGTLLSGIVYSSAAVTTNDQSELVPIVSKETPLMIVDNATTTTVTMGTGLVQNPENTAEGYLVVSDSLTITFTAQGELSLTGNGSTPATPASGDGTGD